MIHSLQKKALFVALLGTFSVAMADSINTNVQSDNQPTIINHPVYNFKDTGSTKLDNDTNINVDVNLAEVFDVTEGTVATTFDTQLYKGNSINIVDPTNAALTGSVNLNQGNVGVNTAAGAFNQQANDVALSVSQGTSDSNTPQISFMVNQEPGGGDNPPPVGDTPTPVKAIVALTGYDQQIQGNDVTIGNPFASFNNNMTASLGSSVQNNMGNVGVNVASGLANQQKNDLAIALSPSDPDLVYASSGGAQLLYDNTYNINTGEDYYHVYGHNFDPATVALASGAYMADSVSGNMGNTGVNVAAGINNQQANGLAIASVGTADLALASAGGMQISEQNGLSSFLSLKADATMNGSVIMNTGNTGVNLAAGIGNQQVNNLAIAVKN